MTWDGWSIYTQPRYRLTEPPRESFGRTAPHIRGKVRILGSTVWMEVVNSRTGKVLATDSIALHTVYGRGTGLPKVVDMATLATIAARGAWTYEFRQKDLK